jgi:hypothetical protein
MTLDDSESKGLSTGLVTSVGLLEMDSTQEFQTLWDDVGEEDGADESDGGERGDTGDGGDEGLDEAMAGTWI